MDLTRIVPSFKICSPNLRPTKTQITSFSRTIIPQISPKSFNPKLVHVNNNPLSYGSGKNNKAVPYENEIPLPSMGDIMESAKAQKLELELQTVGPLFRITAKSVETEREVGRSEGVIRVWWCKGRILHLDSIRLRKETLGMERSIFGIGLFIGALAIRHGYDSGCTTAQLLAINDSDLYHSKLVRFYTRIGFKAVHEVTGSSIGDFGHMVVWGGVGTRMDANIQDLLLKWCTRFNPPT